MDSAHTRSESFHLPTGHKLEGPPLKSLWCPVLSAGRPSRDCPFCRSIFRLNNFPLSPHIFSITRLDGIFWFTPRLSGTILGALNTLYLGLNSTIFKGWNRMTSVFLHRTRKQKKTSKKRFLSEMKIILSEMRAWKSDDFVLFRLKLFSLPPTLKNLINFAKPSTSA